MLYSIWIIYNPPNGLWVMDLYKITKGNFALNATRDIRPHENNLRFHIKIDEKYWEMNFKIEKLLISIKDSNPWLSSFFGRKDRARSGWVEYEPDFELDFDLWKYYEFYNRKVINFIWKSSISGFRIYFWFQNRLMLSLSVNSKTLFPS